MASDTMSIPMKRCQSTALAGYGYDANRGVLAIEFRSGAIYHYQATAEEFEAFDGAESKGRHYGQHFRSRPGLKMTGPCEKCGATGVVGETCTDCGCGQHVRES